MLFHSYIFIFLFLPITWGGYFLLARINHKLANLELLMASFVFYSYFNISYLVLLLASIAFNYLLSNRLLKLSELKPSKVTVRSIDNSRKKIYLICGIVFNVGLLFYFKYMNFFIENVNHIFHTNFILQKIVLPLGISFFTFQQIAYLVDCYRSDPGMDSVSLLEYSLFVSFFPKLIAGPIVLHNELIPQFRDVRKKEVDWENISKGFYIFTLGLAKKVLLADTFGNVVNWGYQNISSLGAVNALLVILGFGIEIYFDFSGYCDMAIGIGRMFNITIPENFNSPYKACSISEFWQRWHMTLTRFLTTHVYIPLGGNRKGKIRTYINIMIVFLVSGLWHGANWTFVCWGGLHGLGMIVNRGCKKAVDRLHPALNWMITFMFINLTWVYFRAGSLSQAHALFKQVVFMNILPVTNEITSVMFSTEFEIISHILSFFSVNLATALKLCWVPLLYIFAIIIMLGTSNTSEKALKLKPVWTKAAFCIFLFVWSVISMNYVNTFLYVNF